MLTDAPPHSGNRAGFLESDRIKTLDLPENDRLPSIAKSIETAMKTGKTVDARFRQTAVRIYLHWLTGAVIDLENLASRVGSDDSTTRKHYIKSIPQQMRCTNLHPEFG